MRNRFATCALSSLALGIGLPAAASGAAATQALPQSVSPAATPSNLVSATPSTTPIELEVGLQLSDQAGAEALERSVSEPTSAGYRHYLTPAQWETAGSGNAAKIGKTSRRGKTVHQIARKIAPGKSRGVAGHDGLQPCAGEIAAGAGRGFPHRF
ncbi:MAG: hypothetical protein LAO08_13075 [Acidobacteriia bacterium]|nr:hypothetical protein [Terriglobia bacterium]